MIQMCTLPKLVHVCFVWDVKPEWFDKGMQTDHGIHTSHADKQGFTHDLCMPCPCITPTVAHPCTIPK